MTIVMRQNIALPLVMILLGFSLMAQASDNGRGLAMTGGAKRVALVIGNDHYQHVDPLENAVADARSVAAALKRAGLPLTIYQPYDALRSDFTPYRKEIRAILEYLARYPSAVLTLEGNTDERGANEMNFAMGQRYADSVKNYLLMQGVEALRIDTVSAGEEKPADFGHTEKAWAKNRRVVIRLR